MKNTVVGAAAAGASSLTYGANTLAGSTTVLQQTLPRFAGGYGVRMVAAVVLAMTFTVRAG